MQRSISREPETCGIWKPATSYFAKLVDAMHQRGMKVILDGVFNHCGSFNKWMDRERIYEPQPDYPKGRM